MYVVLLGLRVQVHVVPIVSKKRETNERHAPVSHVCGTPH